MPKLTFNAVSGEIPSDIIPDFSMFKSLADFAPQTISLTEFIEIIQTCQYGQQIDRVRNSETKEDKQQAKKSLPAVTISGVFSGGRKQEQLIKHSGLICLDFDAEDNPCLSSNYDTLHKTLANDQFSLLTFRSAGGDGLAVVCRIEPDRHLDAFLNLTEHYMAEYGLKADPACKDLSRLRFVSCDPTVRHNIDARLFRRYSLVKELEFPVREPETKEKRPEVGIIIGNVPNIPTTPPIPLPSTMTPTRAQEIRSALSVLSPDEYSQWITIGQAIQSEDATLAGFNLWAAWSDLNDTQGKFDHDKALKKWSTFRGTGTNIETLFKLAYKAGWKGAEAVKPVLTHLNPTYGASGQSQPVTAILPTIKGDSWAALPEEERRPILNNVIDEGDLLEIIAPSKMKKSFFALQMALCAASGRDFLVWGMTGQHKVLTVNFEVKPAWQHRRLLAMAEAMGIAPESLNSVHFCNTRGLQVVNMMASVAATVRQLKPKVVILDPLYMLHDGDENAAHDMKPLIKDFLTLMAESGACLISVHHDPKGKAGDRNIRDRGAGSSIFSRACDARITLTQHAEQDHLLCVDVMARNFPPHDGLVCGFDGYFTVDKNAEYKPETSNTSKTKKLDIAAVAGQSLSYLEAEDMRLGMFRDGILREKLGLPRAKAIQVIKFLLETEDIKKSLQYQGGYWVGAESQIEKRNEWIIKQRG